MSLFKAKDIWAAEHAGDASEEYAAPSLAVGRLLVGEGSEQLAVGSLNGVLRVYDPKGEVSEKTGQLPYRPEQLLLETKLDYPILQVCIGQFVSASDQPALAILHPRKLSIFVLGGSESEQVLHGSQYSLRRAYEHVLQRSAYNMATGPFGGVKGRDFICVQSLDGALSVFEQESPAFSRFLPGSLVPGPLAYAPHSDAFLTVSSAWLLESYKYQNLAVATSAETKEEAANTTSGKRVTPDWSMGLGEAALEIRVFEMPPSQPSILVLGERQIFCFTQGGNLRFINRVDFAPACLCPLNASSEGWVQFLVGAHTKTLMFYSDCRLVWAAQLGRLPVAVARARLQEGLEGCLVSLSADGHLRAHILGTEPSLYGLPSKEAPAPLDFAERQAELRSLQARIRNSTEPPIELKAGSSRGDDLVISAQVNATLDSPSLAYDTEFTETVPSITVIVKLIAKVPLENVILFVRPPYPIVAQTNAFAFSTLSGNQDVPITFFVRFSSVPVSLRVDFKTTYCLVPGVHKVVSGHCQLPLCLAFKPTPAAKSANHKLTLDSARPTAFLNKLFPEMLSLMGEEGGTEAARSALGFQAFGDFPPVSVLVSNNVQKYRIQADGLEGCWCLAAELERRLAAAGGDAGLAFSGTLPLPDAFAILDHHFELGKRVRRLEEMLGQRCAQLRAVERQLLSKFRDTTPAPLAHLDGLIEMTHRQVMKIGDSLEELEGQCRASEAALDAVTQMIQFLLRLQAALPPALVGSLRAALLLVPGQRDGAAPWEARAEAGTTHVLALLGAAAKGGFSGQFTDTMRLKKQITALCDKLSKQSNIVVQAKQMPAPVTRNPPRKLDTIMEDTNAMDVNEGEMGTSEIPAGSNFGDVRGLKAAVKDGGGGTDGEFSDDDAAASSSMMARKSLTPMDVTKLPALNGVHLAQAPREE